MIDWLLQPIKTWLTRQPGPPCQYCGVCMDRGHRYYDGGEKVAHFNCIPKENT